MDDKVWNYSVFTKNRDCLLEGEVAHRFFSQVLSQAKGAGLLSKEHFSVDGTLIEAPASLPRTATEILAARGAFKNHPERKRKQEPKSAAGFPEKPPAHLTPEQAASWQQIVEITSARVLAGSDILITEIAACLLAKFRTNPTEAWLPTPKFKCHL